MLKVGMRPASFNFLRFQKFRRDGESGKRFFEHVRTITAYLVFPGWDTLMTTLVKSKPPPEIAKQFLG